MPLCAQCARSFEGQQCPVCGGPSVSVQEINGTLKKNSWPLIGGLVGVLVATYLYPLLDQNALMLIGLFIFFAPLLTHIVLAIRKSLVSNFGLLRGVYKWAAVVLAVFAGALFANGALDRSPGTQVHATVIQKCASRGRGGTSYSLTVSPSWRSGRDDERLEVKGRTFFSVETGETVSVEVHPGLFGLPWFSEILPD
jgi:uncharacterized membrane protein